MEAFGDRFMFLLILGSIAIIIYAFLGLFAAISGSFHYDPWWVALGFVVLFLWTSFIFLYLRARRKRA